MNIICPKCSEPITGDDLNVATDIGRCRACDTVFRISQTVDAEVDDAVLRNPPKGCRYERTMDGTVISVSTRSPLAFFLVPFMCVWSGASLGGIYGTQVVSGKFNLLMSLFGIPFLLGSILFWTIALMAIWGRAEVRIRRDEAELFTGIGPVGRVRRIKWSSVRSIGEKAAQYKQSAALYIEGDTRTTFGSGLNDERRYFMLSALRKSLSSRR